MSFWDTLLQVGGNIGGAFIGDPAAGTQADMLLNAVDGGDSRGATSALSPALAGVAAQQAASGNAAAIQKLTSTAASQVAPNTANYTNAMLNLYSQIKNPATSAAYQPQSLGSTPQVTAAQLSPAGTVTPGVANLGSGFQFKAPDYASILAQSDPSTLAAPVPGGAPNAPPVGGTAFAPNANASPGGAGSSGGAAPGSNANQATTATLNAQFQQQFGMSPAQWMAANPSYYQPGTAAFNSPQIKLLNSQPGFDFLGASGQAYGITNQTAKAPPAPPTPTAAVPAQTPPPTLAPTPTIPPPAGPVRQAQGLQAQVPVLPTNVAMRAG